MVFIKIFEEITAERKKRLLYSGNLHLTSEIKLNEKILISHFSTQSENLLCF